MAGFFDYLGRVFTEKGSWYKILMVVALQVMAMAFGPKMLIRQAAQGTMPDINVAGLVLYFLSALLILGFSLQIYSNAMNNKKDVLPEVDFADMFLKGLKFLLFCFVWGIYFAVVSMIMPLFALAQNTALAFIGVILLIVVFMIIILSFPAIVALHTKKFSFKFVLNPLTPFALIKKVGAPIAGLCLLTVLLNILLYGFLFAACFILGFSAGSAAEGSSLFDAASMSFGFIVIVVLFLYASNGIAFAYIGKVCDIVKSKLSGTKYLDEDYEVPAEVVENDEELDF